MFVNTCYAFRAPTQRYINRHSDKSDPLAIFRLSTETHNMSPELVNPKKYAEYKINTRIIIEISNFLFQNLNKCYTTNHSISGLPVAQLQKYPESDFIFPLGDKDSGLIHVINRHITGNYKSNQKNTTLLKYLNLERIEEKNLDAEKIAKRLTDIVMLSMDLIKNNSVIKRGDLGIVEKKIDMFGMKNFRVVIAQPQQNRFNMIVGGKVLTVYDW